MKFSNNWAIIIVAAKCFGLLAGKLHAPQVVGEIIAGLLIGPSVLNLVAQNDFLTRMAEIGVVLLMFLAGLETDIKDLLKTGPIAFAVACVGVAVPLFGGYVLYSCFYGWEAVGTEEFYKAVFMGVIMTATSVSITVQTLRELGHLKGRVGTTIVSAAHYRRCDWHYCSDFRDRFQEPGFSAYDGCGKYCAFLPRKRCAGRHILFLL